MVKASASAAVSLLVLCGTWAAEAATWMDWDKRQVCHPSVYRQPGTVDEVVAIVASDTYEQVKVVGAGHSFSQITLTDDNIPAGDTSILLNLDKLNRIIEYPSDTCESTVQGCTVQVEAGIRIHDLNAALLSKGWALENMGAIAMQSVAGATQTSTHGTGQSLGSISTQLRELDIVLANGTIVSISEDSAPDAFAAARVGLGALGIVVRARMSVTKMFKLRRTAMPYPLDQLLRDLPSLKSRYDRLQWYFTPYTNNATLLLREPVALSTPIDPCWPGDLQQLAGMASNVTCVDWSFKALCHEADDATLYTEMEYFVDVSNETQLVEQFLDFQKSVAYKSACRSGGTEAGPCSLFTGVRYAKKDEIWMSPMYGRDIAVLSMIVLGTADTAGPVDEVALFDEGLERIATQLAGRPHWGKNNYARAAELAVVYPRFHDFVALRDAWDPEGLFMNGYLRRVLRV